MHEVVIKLENYRNFCYPGQTIKGRVECNFSKEETLRAIRIRFKGRAKTKWSESRGKHTTTYTAKQVYFDQEYQLLCGGENFNLPQGSHTYPFSYILPQQLASSFIGKKGEVLYSITATVDRPWKFDYVSRIGFSIVLPLDLNDIPRLALPASNSADSAVTSCFSSSGLLTFSMKIPKLGYAPSESINISAFVRNMSRTTVEYISFNLLQNIEYTAYQPKHKLAYQSDTLSSCQADSIGPQSEKSWTSILMLPITFIPNSTNCDIIKINYMLQGEVHLSWWYKNLKIHIPLTIGTTAIHPNDNAASASFIQQQQQLRYAANAPPIDAPSTDIPSIVDPFANASDVPSYSTEDPSLPTYEEAQNLK